LVDISRSFQFGFLRHGIFWGWPSSHTTIAFSIAVTLFVLYPKNLAVRILALLFAFYIGIGVSMSIHWFSDLSLAPLSDLSLVMSSASIFKPFHFIKLKYFS